MSSSKPIIYNYLFHKTNLTRKLFIQFRYTHQYFEVVLSLKCIDSHFN